jgi:hypothetical protein
MSVSSGQSGLARVVARTQRPPVPARAIGWILESAAEAENEPPQVSKRQAERAPATGPTAAIDPSRQTASAQPPVRASVSEFPVAAVDTTAGLFGDRTSRTSPVEEASVPLEQSVAGRPSGGRETAGVTPSELRTPAQAVIGRGSPDVVLPDLDRASPHLHADRVETRLPRVTVAARDATREIESASEAARGWQSLAESTLTIAPATGPSAPPSRRGGVSARSAGAHASRLDPSASPSASATPPLARREPVSPTFQQPASASGPARSSARPPDVRVVIDRIDVVTAAPTARTDPFDSLKAARAGVVRAARGNG